HPAAIDLRFEMFAVKRRRDWKHRALAHSHDPTVAKILGLAFDKKHSPGTDEQERAENVEDELEPLHEFDADPDHDSTNDERANNPPNQCAMLRHSRNSEVVEDDDEDKNVVDAQRVFDHVTGEKFEALLRTADFPDHEIEQQGETDPNQCAMSSCAHAQLTTAMFELNQIES